MLFQLVARSRFAVVTSLYVIGLIFDVYVFLILDYNVCFVYGCLSYRYIDWSNLFLFPSFQKPTGIFHIVDEESMFPGATNASLKDKLDQVSASSSLYSQSIGKNSTFAINHYAGKVMPSRSTGPHALNGHLIECLLSPCHTDC